MYGLNTTSLFYSSILSKIKLTKGLSRALVENTIDLSSKFTSGEVNSAMVALKPHACAGWDDIPPGLYKDRGLWGIWTNILATIFTVCIKEKKLSRSSLQCVIRPIFKKENGDNPECYGPIMLSNVVSKLYMTIIMTRTSQVLEYVLPQEQFGFRNGTKTSMARLVIYFIFHCSSFYRKPFYYGL